MRRRTREMLSAASRRGGRKLPAGQSVPPPTAGRPRDPRFEGALAALRTELEVHRCKAVETEALIARLIAYAGAEEFPVETVSDAAPTHRRRRRRGRPPADAGDALRVKKRDAMRRRRARLRDEAAAAVSPAVPPAKPPKPQRPKAAAPSPQKPEPAATVPMVNGGPGKKRRKRPKNAPPVKMPTSGVKPLATEWTAGADGTLSRELVAPGEAVPLKLV